MKLRLPTFLCTALLACMACATTVHAATYLAEGVNPDDLEGSERFYDGGKGRDWDDFERAAYSIYTANGNDLSIFGDLASSITVPEYQSLLDCSKLYSDSGHCWAYTSSNMLQYWQTYYGVFSKKAREDKEAPVHGHNYDRSYLTELGGTQSLKLNKLFYDNFLGTAGGGTNKAFGWYLQGENDWGGQLVAGSAPGYFSQYFAHYNDTHQTVNGQNLSSLAAMSDSIKQAFGYSQQNGEWAQTTKGQIMHLELKSGSSSHAITCYGFETDEEGNIKALYVVNSDDGKHELIKVYTKFVEYGSYDYRLELHYDEACTGYNSYNAWTVTGWSNINTPEALKNMLAEYEKGNLTWMGNLESWTDPITVEEDVNVLPTDETGWMVYAGTGTEHAGYYNAYYSNERGVEFNDDALSSTVKVAEDISLVSMEVNNSEKDYVFNGEGQTIRTLSLTKTGTGALEFNGVKLDVVDDLIANGNTITFTDDADIGSIDKSSLIIKGGTTKVTIAVSWTSLQSLEMSDQAALNIGSSLEVASNITETEAVGTLAEGTRSGITTNYCLVVGTAGDTSTGNVSLAGDITAGSYIHILGNASVGGNINCIANYFGDNDSHIDIAGNADIGGNLSAVQYINIGGDAEVGGTLSSGKDVTIGGNGTIHGAVNVSGNLTAAGQLTLNQGGTIGGSLLADTIILKGDTSIQNIGTSTEEHSSLGEATLIVSSGSSKLNTTWWTNLKSLQLSDQAKLSFTTSVSVADSISTCESTGTLPEGTEAGLETTYCIYVGTKDKAGTGNVNLAGNMTANAYIEILGDATVTKVNDSLGNVSAREHLFIGGDANIAGNVGTVGKTASETAYEVHDSNITINGNATIGGSLTAVAKESGKKADILIGGNATIGGDLSATSTNNSGDGASITIEGNATIGGKIQTKGDISIGGNATIGGEVSGGTTPFFVSNSAGALTVGGDLKGDVEEGHVFVKATSIEIGGTASHVELTANSLTLQDNITLDSVILKQTGSRTMTLNNVTFVGDSGIDGSSSSTESLLTLHANNVTFVLDDSNSQAAVFPFGGVMPLAEDDSITTTEEVTPRFVISSSILDGVSLTGSVTLDISHWTSAMKESGVSTLDLFVGDVVELTESANVVLYDGERYITPVYTENGVQMAIPEPTTATLSLLALAALAARRRR